MQPTTMLLQAIKSGKITISQNNVEQVEIKAHGKQIDVDAKKKEFIKEIVTSTQKPSEKKGITEKIKLPGTTISTVRKIQPFVKEVVEDMCKEGVTVTLSYKGDKVVTVGAQADGKISKLLTGTRGIQVNNTTKLIELGI
ncbi:MAG: hypothetical protein NWF00_03250 [Candidatus Bathyarchaeota archaeon]|nr:hypothetical protein [Candidatus Bathyarchaeota archaeon]